MNYRWASLYAFWGLPWTIPVVDSPRTNEGPSIVIHSNPVVWGPGPASLRVTEALCPSWAQPNQPYRFYVPPVADLSFPGEPLAWLERDGHRLPVIVQQGETINFAFDLEEAILSYILELHWQSKRSLLSRLPFDYHVIPDSVRFWAGRIMTKLLGRKQPTVADCINPSVELLRGIFRKVIRRMDGESSPNRVLWPEGKTYAVALSHDVDTEAGLRNVPLIAQMESKYGLRSSYNLVARGYPLDSGLLKELKSEGFELGLHGEVHDCRLPYLRRAEMIEAIERCRPFIEQYGVVGFRAPFLLRSEELYEVLGKYFQYDTSVPDVELYSLFTSNKGCGSVFPYFRKELCILPITLPLDGVLLLRGCSPEEILRIWMSKVEWIRRIGGLVLLDSHPEPYFGGSPSMMAIYEEFLAEISSDTSAWHALPREVSAWCKEG